MRWDSDYASFHDSRDRQILANSVVATFCHDLQQKALRLKTPQIKTLAIITRDLHGDELAHLRKWSLSPEDYQVTEIVNGSNTIEKDPPLWISLPKVWRPEEEAFRENNIPYVKYSLRVDAMGRVRIVEMYWNVFDGQRIVVCLRPLVGYDIDRLLNSQWVQWSELLTLIESEDKRDVFVSNIQHMSDQLQTEAVNIHSACIKTLALNPVVDLTAEEKDRIWESRLVKTETKENDQTPLFRGISLPRIWRPEEKNLRLSKQSYEKICLRYDYQGKASILSIYQNWSPIETIVIVEEKTSDHLSYELKDIFSKYQDD